MNDFYRKKYEDFINEISKQGRDLFAAPGYEIHHIIPRYIYKQKNLDIDNSPNNLIKLTTFEHLKAHKYWALYMEDVDACLAFSFLYGVFLKTHSLENVTDEELEEIALIREKANERNRGSGNPMYGKPSANKGIPMSTEQKNKIAKALKGHVVTEKTREKISRKNKGRTAYNKGVAMSESQKAKLSAARKGISLSEETKRKIKEGNIGKKKPSRSLQLKGTHWYNDGFHQVQAFECPEGYVKGKLPRKN